MRYLVFGIVCVLLSVLTAICFAADFPYRDKYPEVTIIELNDLKSGYDNGEFLIIDLRSKTEFDAIHIKNATHLPYGHAKFTTQLGRLAEQNPAKKIVVYCNGIDCIKSYKAGEDAMYAMIPNVLAFDAGVANWAEAYPSETLLMGEEIKNPKKQLISAEEFIHKKINIEDFKEKSANRNAVVIDARDPIQRKDKVPGLENAMLIPLDKLISNVVNKGHLKDKQLLVFDQVGRQVNWLMYYFVDKGYKDFYFLDGGATAILKSQEYRLATR